MSLSSLQNPDKLMNTKLMKVVAYPAQDRSGEFLLPFLVVLLPLHHAILEADSLINLAINFEFYKYYLMFLPCVDVHLRSSCSILFYYL